jgi:pantothenate kinase
LIRLLAGYENYEDALEACTKGDNAKVDMTVKDIYGGSCLSLGLSEDILASTMGRAQYIKDKSEVKPEDISRSVIMMMCINISQLASLVADAEGIDTVVVQGFPHLGFQKLFKVNENLN